MPSKHIYEVETCWPCIHLKKNLFKSGLNPIGTSYCCHPSQIAARVELGGKGRFIGENTDGRPSWCPIRGNAAAEAEARGDVELDDNED